MNQFSNFRQLFIILKSQEGDMRTTRYRRLQELVFYLVLNFKKISLIRCSLLRNLQRVRNFSLKLKIEREKRISAIGGNTQASYRLNEG